MNISLTLGVALAFTTLWFGVFKSTSNPLFYLDSHAMILVCGGTLAAALIGFPLPRIIALVNTFFGWFIRKESTNYRIVEEIYDVAIYYRNNKELLNTVEFTNPFLREGFDFVKAETFDAKQVQEILSKRITAYRKELQNDAKTLTALSKFPPAFGLLGACTGMISMMLSLNEGGTKAIGPAMATALVATFWGIGISNLVFLPLADNANKIAVDEAHTRRIILDGLILIKMNEDPHVIVQILKSHLKPEDRAKVRVLRTLGHKQTPRTKAG